MGTTGKTIDFRLSSSYTVWHNLPFEKSLVVFLPVHMFQNGLSRVDEAGMHAIAKA